MRGCGYQFMLQDINVGKSTFSNNGIYNQYDGTKDYSYDDYYGYGPVLEIVLYQ